MLELWLIKKKKI